MVHRSTHRRGFSCGEHLRHDLQLIGRVCSWGENFVRIRPDSSPPVGSDAETRRLCSWGENQKRRVKGTRRSVTR